MKKILFCLIMITTNIISMAVKNVDLKLATNFGIGLEGGTYYNLYGGKNYSRKIDDSGQAIFKNKVAFIGSFEAKVLKSFNINKDLKIKIGAGTGIDITKLPILDEFVAVTILGKKEDFLALPHTNGWEVGLKNPFQNEVNKLQGNWGLVDGDIDDAETQMPKLIDLSRKPFYTSLAAFGSIEIEKRLNNFSVYFGLDAGVDIVLAKIEETATYESKKNNQYLKYVLERRKSRIRPKVKGYTGINYKGFETEIGLGYPQFVTLGIGYRFNF